MEVMVTQRLIAQTVSFKPSLKGLYFVTFSQKHFLFHLSVGTLVILAGFYFGLTRLEWLVLLPTIFLVLVAEALNTALELATDGLKLHKKTEQDDFYIMVAKDVAASAVLLAALNAVVVGAIIFLPKVF